MDSPYMRNVFLAGTRDFDGWSNGRVGSDKTKVKKQVENRLLHFIEDKIVPLADRLLPSLFLSVGRCIFGRLLFSVGRCAFGGLLFLSVGRCIFGRLLFSVGRCAFGGLLFLSVGWCTFGGGLPFLSVG